eukprot:CAMPEP_0185755378 /NCGR_PEP_ID=MMETSP1174-20130828/13880_1 /TAXON_ID=35687 /ORGANISM="Dictyocha speculum, Strain CCMP1381" /LENGTH=211 /DNA_ID=CAMNT_0028433901 /DNA_START=40 /DNA_END=675 /DNA_ORIENTATION=-
MARLSAAILVLALGACNAFAPRTFSTAATSMRRSSRASVEMAAVLAYSTTTGNTETCAGYITEVTGLEAVDISDVTDDDIAAADCLICGAPTWHTGADEQRSGTEWDGFLYERLPNLDLSGKKIGIFGLGDQAGYGDNYVDAMGELYDLFTAKGATICGFTSTDGYDHTESKSIRDGKFVGMAFDEDNQYDLSEGRAKAWCAQLESEGMSW